MLAFGRPFAFADEELVFAAKMTDRQFRAIGHRIRSVDTIDELRALPRIESPKRSATCDENEVQKWLTNAWNTEHILYLSSAVLQGASGAALQWTFPQAYYAVFAHTLAFFQIAGYNETAHVSVKRRFAMLSSSGDFPRSIGFAADSTKNNMTFIGLSPHEDDVSSVHFDAADPESWDRQIQQFLKSTRESELDQKKEQMKLRTAAGDIRKRYEEEHWEQVAAKVGPTGLLCLLYRKRIKANYRDIDTFTASGMDPTPIFESLAIIVDEVALILESFIAAALGFDAYSGYAAEYLKLNKSYALQSRIEKVRSVATG